MAGSVRALAVIAMVLAISAWSPRLAAADGTDDPGLTDADRRAVAAVIAEAKEKAPLLGGLRNALTTVTRSEDGAQVEAIAQKLRADYAGLTGRLQTAFETVKRCTTAVDLSLPPPSWNKTYRAGTVEELEALEQLIRSRERQELDHAGREVGMRKDVYQARAQAINAILVNIYLPTKNQVLGSLEAFSDAIDGIYAAIDVCNLKYSPLLKEPPVRMAQPRPDIFGKTGDAKPEPDGSLFDGMAHDVSYFFLNNVLKNMALISLVVWSWQSLPLGLASTAMLGYYWFFW